MHMVSRDVPDGRVWGYGVRVFVLTGRSSDFVPTRHNHALGTGIWNRLKLEGLNVI